MKYFEISRLVFFTDLLLLQQLVMVKQGKNHTFLVCACIRNSRTAQNFLEQFRDSEPNKSAGYGIISNSPIMRFLTKRTLPILFGIVSLISSAIANGHVQNSDDTIEIESDDIQLRWLDKSTMQIIWTGKEGMEDGRGNEDSTDNGLFSQSSTKSSGESSDNSEMASSDTASQSSNMENIMDSPEDRTETADVEEKVVNGELLFLTPSVKFKFENESTVCRFRGKLENHPLARASVVGCEREEISFVNINIGGRFYVLNLNNKDGRTWKKIRNPSLDTIVKVRGKRSPYYRAPPPSGVQDFVETDEPRPNLLASREGPPPKAITLPYTLGIYSESSYKEFNQI